MTIQEAYKKIISSEDLKKKGIEALKAGKADEFLKEQGFDITVDQIKDYLQKKKSGELSREELDLAAGGGDCGKMVCDVVFSVGTVLVGCTISALLIRGDFNKKIRECEY